MKRTAVDLFSGVGGFALACEWAGVETIAFAEIDDYARRVLRKHWPGIRNYGDVRSIPAIGDVWLVTGGVPCQPASVAGKRRGTEDDRWLWPEALAVVERVRPEWVLFENPTGILSLNDGVEFERICAALEGQGYEVQPIVIPACAVGAPHRRNRVWIVAYSQSRQNHKRERRNLAKAERCEEGSNTSTSTRGEDVADAKNNGCKRSGQARSRRNGFANNSQDVPVTLNDGSYRTRADEAQQGGNGENDRLFIGSDSWATEPELGRVANGIPKRVDRLRCLGNAIVPQVAYQIIKRMIEAESL